MLHKPFFDPTKSYYENWEQGPFGEFTDGVVLPVSEPKFSFLGIPLSYPLGIPAGPLLNAKFVDAALDKGFDVPIHKTVRSRKYDSNPFPNVLGADIEGELTLEKLKAPVVVRPEYNEPLSITNSFGNPSYEPEIWQADLKKSLAHAKDGQLVMCSFEGTPWEGTDHEQYVQDWVNGFKMIESTGVKVIEANFSCPNEGHAALLCFDIPKVKMIASRIKAALNPETKLIIKVAFYGEAELRELVQETHAVVDGYAAINTLQAKVVNPDGTQALPGGVKRERSGICGAAIKWAGLDMVRRLAALRKEMGLSYGIIGSGGMTTPDDFKAFRDAGADIVMTATAAMWNPYLAKEIREKYPEA